MSAKSVAVDADSEIALLIEVLHDTSRRLEELTAGEVDSVANREGRSFLLPQAQDDLRHSEAAKKAAILNGLPAHIALLDDQGVIVSVNEGWRLFADANVLHAPGHGVGLNYIEICDGANGDNASEARQVAEGIRSVLRGDVASFSIEYPCHSPTEQRWFLLAVTPLAQGGGNGAVVMHLDITRQSEAAIERKAIEEALFAEKERSHVTLNSIGDAVVCTDVSGNITFLNLVAENLTGWPSREAAGRPMAEVLRMLDAVSREPIAHPTEMWARAPGTVQHPSDSILLKGDGSEIPIENSVAPIHDSDGKVTGAVFVMRDVSEARAMTLRMAHSAEHDVLTGLPNRMLLNDRIAHAIALAGRHIKKVAVLFLDLDGFKHVNDSLGHPVGDRLLQSVAGRLVDCIRVGDTVSRQGGDEFVVLLSEVEDAKDAGITARRMLKALAETHSIGANELHVTTSIGVSIYPDDGRDAESLIKNADTAMYQAKENGRHGFQFFKPAMNVRAVERQWIEEGLRRAIEHNELTVHYQPKVDLRTGAISGAEALVRWHHPERG